MSESPSLPDPPNCYSREQKFHAKTAGRLSIVPHVERDKRIRAAVDRRLQHHLVAGIPELRAPKKMRFHGLSHRDHRRHKNIHLPLAQPGSETVLSLLANSFVLHG